MTDDPRRYIENSDRGITINKSLAWTMFSAIAVLIWWGGTTIQQLTSSTEQLTAALAETRAALTADRAYTTAVESRVRVLENGATRQDARFDGLQASLAEVKQAIRETNDLLRRMSAP